MTLIEIGTAAHSGQLFFMLTTGDVMYGKALQLSTAHMPNNEPDFGDYRSSETEYGYIVWPKGDNAIHAPDWLRYILNHADANDCCLVEFDRDNDVSDDFQTFDW